VQVDRGFFTNVKELHTEGDVQADFSDLRKLHILTDKLLRLAHILRLNIRLGCQLKHGISGLRTSSSPALSTSFDETQARLDQYTYGQETSLTRIETLIARSAGIGQLVSIRLNLNYDVAEICSRAGPRYSRFPIKRSEQANKPGDAKIDRTEHQRKRTDETTHGTVYKGHSVYDDNRINLCDISARDLFSSKWLIEIYS